MQGQVERCADFGLGIPDAHADQRAVRGHRQFVHVAFDAVGFGEVMFRGVGVDVAAGFRQKTEMLAEPEVEQTEAEQNGANRQRPEHGKIFQGGDAGRQILVRRAQEIVQQHQRRVADHGQLRAENDAGGDGQQQLTQTEAGAAGKARGNRKEQRRDCGILHESGHAAGRSRGNQHQPLFLTIGAAQQPAGQPVQRTGAVQRGAENHGSHHADYRVTGESLEQLGFRNDTGEAEDDQRQQGGGIGADALEHQHGDDEAGQTQYDQHVLCQDQTAMHA